MGRHARSPVAPDRGRPSRAAAASGNYRGAWNYRPGDAGTTAPRMFVSNSGRRWCSRLPPGPGNGGTHATARAGSALDDIGS